MVKPLTKSPTAGKVSRVRGKTGPRGARYPIRAVARLTGLSVDTLRAWERRYDVVTPSRDDRGRLYSDQDVRRLQLLATAVGRGHAIGRLAPLSDAEIEGLIAAPAAPHAVLEAAHPSGDPVGVLLSALAAFDYMAVERELNRLALALAPRDLVHRVVLPVMKRVGDDWYAERLTIAQEHLISSALRNLLGALVRLYAREQAVRRLLFATPSGERHEFGILAAAMLAAAGGLGVVYLGPDLPGRQIVDVAARTAADVAVLGVIHGGGRELRRQLEYVVSHLPAPMELWVGGALPSDVEQAVSGPHVVRLSDFQALEKHLARVGARF